jgi:hypothetical protein
MRRAVLPHVCVMNHRALVLDVWVPVALMLPLLFQAGRVDGSVAGAGWLVVAAPVMCGLLGLAAALVISMRGGEFTTPSLGAIGVWTIVGVLLLMLAAAHALTFWIGQCSFATGAVLLWMNTPDPGPAKPAKDDPREAAAIGAGWGMMGALGCAVGHGAAVIMVPDDLWPVSGGVTLGGVAILLAWAARLAGPNAALRIGGWTAAFGVLFGLGVLSLTVMIPFAFRVLVGVAGHGDLYGTSRTTDAAYGFERFALEGLLLVVLGATAVGISRLSRFGKAVTGWLLFVGAAALIAWRLAASMT